MFRHSAVALAYYDEDGDRLQRKKAGATLSGFGSVFLGIVTFGFSFSGIQFRCWLCSYWAAGFGCVTFEGRAVRGLNAPAPWAKQLPATHASAVSCRSATLTR